ncbi:Cytochrome P450 71A9 [Acorus gramineus]|uniref:Cytochrome P450 71A9 n=1 Tax=Acorus gramineus TaxID=55184 RepID=A0AAV9AXS3_ACOGR|nr:Cytochrome P450 71A9 [Acorus gramineus]
MLHALLAVLLVPLLLILREIFSPKKSNLPPSPSKLPIIGHLHHISSPMAHRAFHALSQKHGDIMHLQLGLLPTVVITSSELAQEILKTQDTIFANRPSLFLTNKLFYGNRDITFTRYGEYWKQVKKISVIHLLNSKKVQSFRDIREDEVARLIEKVYERASLGPVNLSRLLNSLTNNMISRVAVGRRITGGDKLNEMIISVSELFESSWILMTEYFPFVGAALNKINGMDARIGRLVRDWDVLLDQVIEDHKNNSGGGGENNNKVEDLVDILLSRYRDQDVSQYSLTMDQIKAIIMDMFVAGTDTSFVLLEWTMSQLIKNPRVMKVVQAEVRSVVEAGKPSVGESDMVKLPYLKAVVKEGLRIHPPGPILIPHESLKDATVQGYHIPAKTRIIINAWAIGRDPKYWEAPEEFRPERFLEGSLDFKGNDFQFIPFSAGRRICPGISFAVSEVELTLANLLYRFDWKLPEGEGLVEDLNMDEEPGITVKRKYNLRVIATPYQ